MTKRMLIDGTHPEETRVVVMTGNRLDEHDVETSRKKQIKGNIYLAKVTRVEPSLQAAFIDYGGNRHGFLAFDEIHPDYYQIPVEDREALIAQQAEMDISGRAAQQHIDEMDGSVTDRFVPASDDGETHETNEAQDAQEPPPAESTDETEAVADAAPAEPDDGNGAAGETSEQTDYADDASREAAAQEVVSPTAEPEVSEDAHVPAMAERSETTSVAEGPSATDERNGDRPHGRQRRHGHAHRRYKIQEVIKRRQILLVQVVKEERGNKGAALTTYISLAGRYCVLMPNSTRSGGISRKVTSPIERRKLRKILEDLEMPDGMGVIVRTAGMERSKAEIKRDFDYLVRTWDEIREQTLKSSAPALVYEEANIIKRAIRDLYSKEMEEVLVEGDEPYQAAKNMMRLLMPSHAKRVKAYKDEDAPLFHRYQVEGQLDMMHQPEVHLKSGGYIVIHATEALVAIDVNSGKSTRERNIEETALKTNLEAADEVARQLRLRDLAGLVVIDFIDMEETRNMRSVERRVKEAMKTDRARIQIGRISAFGLLELSRQRLRPSLLEASTEVCSHCHGTGHVRSTESMSVRVLRSIEDEGIRRRSAEIAVAVAPAVALYLLNQKRNDLVSIEARYGFRVDVRADATMTPSSVRIDRIRARDPAAAEAEPHPQLPPPSEPSREIEVDADADADAEDEAPVREVSEAAPAAEGEGRRGRRRRGRRRRGEEAAPAPEPAPIVAEQPAEPLPDAAASADEDGDQRRRRRRGRRGGRRRRRGWDETRAPAEQAAPQADTGWSPDERPAPARPVVETPADWTPYPRVASDDQPVADIPASDDDTRPSFPGNGDGGPVQRTDYGPEAPSAANPPAPRESDVPARRETSSEAGPKEPKRRGWWQRMVE